LNSAGDLTSLAFNIELFSDREKVLPNRALHLTAAACSVFRVQRLTGRRDR